MNIKYKEITQSDLKILTEMRIQFLSEITTTTIPPSLSEDIMKYLAKHIEDDTCFGLFGFEGDNIIAVGLICVYEVLPDEFNSSGRIGKLYNIYTLPEYRGHGIMKTLIENLMVLSSEKGITELCLAAEKKALPLYERLGFKLVDNEMVKFMK